MTNAYEENDKLKKEKKKVLIDIDTLEDLRRTWFEMGYEVGSRKRGKGDINEEYQKIRRPMNEDEE